jgi:YD repeat-containing protein
MKKVFYGLNIATLICFYLFSSCSKSSSSGSNNNNNGGGGTTVSDLVASFTNNNSSTGVNTVYTFSYDSQNRLIEEQISDGTPTAAYSYGTGTVTKTQGTTTTVYTLNNAGYAASDNQGNTYTYDANGFMTNETNPNGSSTVNTISNNNIVSTVQTPAGGSATTYTFTFGTKPNTLKFGNTFLGAPDTDLIQSEGINGVNYPFTYTYDSHGRVQTEKIVSGSTTLLRTYTYIN